MHITTTSSTLTATACKTKASFGGIKTSKAERLATKNTIISIGWADMPYQGDYMIDFASAVSSSVDQNTTSAAKQESLAVGRPSSRLSNIILQQRPSSPIRLKRNKRMAQTTKTAIGWSDLPCQGDYVMDFSWAISSRNKLSSSSYNTRTGTSTRRNVDIIKQQMTTHHHHHHNAKTIQLRPIRVEKIKKFSWADMPYQGDCGGMDFETSENTLRTMNDVTNTSQRQSVKKSKRVQFSFVEVRTYEVVLGSHPFCVEGMALELGWKHYGTERVAMNDHQQQQKRKHRDMSEFHMPFEVRRDRLLELTDMTGAELIELEQSRWLEEQCQRGIEDGDDFSLGFTISPCA